MHPIRTVKYILQVICALLNPRYRMNDEFGKCSVCGNYSRFKYGASLNSASEVAISCGWDEYFINEINITNSLKCGYCMTKFRVRCAAESMLIHSWKGRVGSVAELVGRFRDGKMDSGWKALETTATEGIFSGFGNVGNVVRSEYFDDVERGCFRGDVRSEDLQALTFEDNSFDAVIALDVFEHIADPMKAFAEINRVLRSSGIAIITVPLDARIKETKAVAKIEDGRIVYIGKQAYHSDPLRKEGAPVFTEFGTDILNKLKSLGYNASWDIYTTRRTNVRQRVLVMTKR